jgi:hypothetical protein
LTNRDTVSAPPPAPNGTTHVIGLVGQLCAGAAVGNANSVAIMPSIKSLLLT